MRHDKPISFSRLFRAWLLDEVYEKQAHILTYLEKIMTTIADLPQLLGDLRDELAKAKEEIIKKISDLEDALEHLSLPPEAETALAAVKAAADALDAIVPDTPPVL
jgi:vacuolar-type H+-ATPase subunit E/Vma4